ncbi:cytochrome c biogenesis CcdA family protein [Salibacterium qingdaonense]|uniref:Cytochrome c-type biogenesis protein n=1 Tax=Salibacterium qingdaonense TaxID=266892 RepID=A0A1I4JBK6_9BACI|nr:cytochrome c biogenesis protein CcdA [Salibacterium qingdaonense]SFL63972.1 cytochrome c-type biogenesis protein [Salibacterium qingdaonense]
MNEVSIWLAFGAGVVSFLSPCIFPLVPAYLAQLTGSTVADGEVQVGRRIVLSRSLGFILGFTLIFMVLGLTSTTIGSLLNNSRTQDVIQQVGGIVIILFGLQMTGIISIKALMSDKKLHRAPKKSSSFAGSVFFGVVFAAGWTPCIGLVLGGILTLAGSAETMYTGLLMLFIYSMGLGIPFLIVGLLYSKSLYKLKGLNKWLPRIQRGSGLIMIALGILLFTGYFQTLSAYFAQFNPFSI